MGDLGVGFGCSGWGVGGWVVSVWFLLWVGGQAGFSVLI